MTARVMTARSSGLDRSLAADRITARVLASARLVDAGSGRPFSVDEILPEHPDDWARLAVEAGTARPDTATTILVRARVADYLAGLGCR